MTGNTYKNVMYHRLTFSRFIDEYPHVTLALSGFFGAILLLFFLWFTLFLGLHKAHAAAPGVDECSQYPLHGSTTAVLYKETSNSKGVANSGVFYFDSASIPTNPVQNVYLPPVTKRACAVKIPQSKNYQLKGWAWNDNFGWASFYCPGPGGNNLGVYCGDQKYGVTIDDKGNFSGYAWSNAGWIRFTCAATSQFKDHSECQVSNYGVKLDLQKVDKYGYAPLKPTPSALSQNVGWLNFTGVQVPFKADPLILEDQNDDGVIDDGDVVEGNPKDPWNPGGEKNPFDAGVLQLTSTMGTNNVLKLSWKDTTYTAGTTYSIYRSDAVMTSQKGENVADLKPKKVDNVQGKMTDDETIPQVNKDYYYLVAVIDSSGTIVKISNNITVNIQVKTGTGTGAPAGLFLTGTLGSDNVLNLSWSDPLYSPGALYHVYRSTAAIVSAKGAVPPTTKVWAGLSTTRPEVVPADSTAYYYVVATLDANGKIAKVSNNVDVQIAGKTVPSYDTNVSGGGSGGGPSGIGENGGSGGTPACTAQSCPPFSCTGTDADADGFCPIAPAASFKDCNDNDQFTSPASPEICGDNIDNDCNGVKDDLCGAEGAIQPVTEAVDDYTFNIPYTIGNSSSLVDGALSLGSALRADVRNLIFKNAQQLKRSASTQCGTLGNILYFQLQDDVYYCKGDVTIGPVAPWTGRKTIIVEDGNVHIRGDIFPDNFDAQLGLIVLRTKLQDSTKANVYIGPNVHNLRLQLFADGSMFPGLEDAATGKVKKLGGSAVPKVDASAYGKTGALFGQLFLQGLFVTHNNVALETYLDSSKLPDAANGKYPDAFGKNTIADPNVGKFYSLSFLRGVQKDPDTVTKSYCKNVNAKFSATGENACAQPWGKVYPDLKNSSANSVPAGISKKLFEQDPATAQKGYGVVIFYEPPASDLPGFTNLGAASAVQR